MYLLSFATRRQFVLCVLLGICSHYAVAYDLVFRGDFQIVADAPQSDAQAARFLTMATFGPTTQSIAQLRGVGYAQWIDQQLAMPTTLERPGVQALDASVQNPGQRNRRAAWFAAALTAPDQLRQRAAWALSQIMVVSDRGNKLNQDPVAMAEYYDTLARDAFGYYDANDLYHVGTYANLLTDVTYSPAMGKMLTYVHNDKGNPAKGSSPDENYAREVLQLFSIGLIQRNLDFSPIYANGNPIPTYDQSVVTGNAHVFTGLAYDPQFSDGWHGFPTNGAGWTVADYLPLFCYENHHDENPKFVLDGVLIDNPAPNCNSDFAQLISLISNHPNVAPFISRQLIQRFTDSNPTPAYIERVANVFLDNGQGVYGDLGAVIRAVLLDPEAQYNATPPPAPYVFGKPREPLLKLIAFWRYYHAAAQDGEYDFSPAEAYGQSPLDAFSVFNFYLPDYLPPGELGAAGLYAPELQIEGESAVAATANDLIHRAMQYVGAKNVGASTIAVDLSSLFALAADPNALVAQVNHDLMYGSMSSGMQQTLIDMVGALPYSTNAAQVRVLGLLQVVFASPAYSIQK